MKAKNFMISVKRGVHNVGFQMKKHAPELCLIGGIVGVGAGIVLACIATTKIDKIKEETDEDIDAIKRGVEDGEVFKNDELVPYTKADGKRDIRLTYAKAGLKYARLYAPAAVLTTAALMLIVQGNRIQHRRYAALAAAYATLDKNYSDYRARVRERFGEDLDEEIRYDAKVVQVEEKITGENGKEKKVKKKVTVLNSDAILDDDFTFLFDPAFTPDATGNLDYDEMRVNAAETYAGHQLVAYGRLFMNDILKDLGFETTKAGQVCGWTLNVEDETHKSDGYVSFDTKRVMVDFGEGDIHESLLLKFNCEGDVWQFMKEKDEQ